MVDGDRVYPVLYLFLHHSTGPDFVDTPDRTIRDWYSNIGKGRGYNNGALNPRHSHPDTGELSYAMAQFAGSVDNSNKYGFKVIDLIQAPWANVTWSVGDWGYNQRSASVEICGNFMDKILPEKALMCIADWLRPVDQELMEAGVPHGLTIMLHQEVFNTACPGRIKEQRDTIVDMINNPDKWNKKLWPPTPPAPVITTKTETRKEAVPYTSKTIEVDHLGVNVKEITQKGVNGERTITTSITYKDGVEIKREDTTAQITRWPIEEIISVGKYRPMPTVPTDYDKEQDNKLSGLTEGLTSLLAAIGRSIADFLAIFRKG